MASVEFIQKRIEGKQKEIDKLEKKLERIHKAQSTNWEVNPYYYRESDLKWTTRDLEVAKKALAEYEDALVKETEKSNSRNIPAIIEFLDMWKDHMKEFYTEDAFPRFLEARKEYYARSSEYTEWWNTKGWRTYKENPEEYKRIEKERRDLDESYRATWNFIMPYVDGDAFNLARLDKDLNEEANRKYDFIIERTNEIVGTITDATDLKVSRNGELNGNIIGTKGVANVKTIGAGGWNVQCFHCRTLIHRVK